LPEPRAGVEFADSGATRWRRVSSILGECGVRRAAKPFLAALARRLADERIFSRPLLTEAGLDRHDRVQFALVPFPPDAMLFDKERELLAFIEAAVGTYGPLKGLRLKGTEYRLRSLRRVDLLCEEKARHGALVAIELKRTTSVDGVVNQLTRYLHELKDEPIAGGRSVRGIIISGREDETVAESLAGRTDIEWYCCVADLRRVWPR
ncbi:MAG: Endonuclease NucS, partial [candidate division NC10 bacterium]|nr:Endonuclease NucS [candidate division NC10 bacterium]